MRIVIKPLGIIVIMASFTALASVAIYSIGPKPASPSADSSDDFGKPMTPVQISTLNPSTSASVAEGSANSTASDPVAPVTGPLLASDISGCMVLADPPTKVAHTIVSDPTTPNAEKHYLHTVIIKNDPSKSWIDQFERTVDVDVPAGQNLVLSLVARSSTRNPVDVFFLRNGADHHDDLDQGIVLTPEWKTYTFTLTTSRTYLSKSADAGAAVCIHIGKQTGTIDLAALQVVPADKATSPGTP